MGDDARRHESALRGKGLGALGWAVRRARAARGSATA